MTEEVVFFSWACFLVRLIEDRFIFVNQILTARLFGEHSFYTAGVMLLFCEQSTYKCVDWIKRNRNVCNDPRIDMHGLTGCLRKKIKKVVD